MSSSIDSAPVSDSAIAQWQTVVSMQMHFNDMILRTRAIGSSVVLAAYGAAAVSIGNYPTQHLVLFTLQIHVSAIIIVVALSLLLSIYLMDVTYYYKLLLKVVDIGTNLENINSGQVDPTNQLTQQVSRGWATRVIHFYYGIPATIGGLSLWYVITNYPLPAAQGFCNYVR